MFKQALVNGISLAYRDEGSGPVLLLIHGFPLTHAMWNLQIEEFKRSYHIIAPDLRGFGQSGGGNLEQFGTVDQYADDLAALLDTPGLSGQKVIVMGLSMGGYVAFAFWRRYARRVRALILCDTRSGPDTEEGKQDRYKLIEQVRQRGASPAAETMVPKLFAPETYNTRPDLVGEMAGLIERNNPAGIVYAAGALAARPDSTPDLKHITVPCLVVVGQHDALTPVERSREIVQELPDWQLSIVPHAGHMPNLENPAFFNQAVETFLRGVEKTNASSAF